MIIGLPKETRSGEARVAATPEVVKKYVAKKAEVVVERDAGAASSFPDSEYEAAGARIVSRDDAFAADLVLKVACPTPDEATLLEKDALLVSMIDPFGDGQALMDTLAAARVSCIGMELIPRITRAQAMDVLSSQANIAGYRAVVEAAHAYGKLFPMMMTAAGSVPPSKCIVLGVGVAGLQAIATAKRLGAQVEAFDVRPEVREQVQSVGAKWLDLGLDETGAGEGGYAKELSEGGKRKQKEALTRAIPKADIVITTAQIPGRQAPELVTEEAVRNMRPGSVIVDMAAGSGGNCSLSEPDSIIVKHNVVLIGHTNLPSAVANHSSRFFARNLNSLLDLMVVREGDATPSIKYDLEDEIIDAALVTHGGERRWPKKKES